MNKEELTNRIKYLREIEHLSTRQIAEELRISRGRCLRICSSRSGPDKIPAHSFLEPYRGLVAEWYAMHPSLRASQVWQRLLERGVNTSYTSVKRLTRPFRKKRTRSYWSLTFAPGEEAQVDWFIVDHPHLGRLAGFALILSFSRFLYAEIFPRLSFEFFIQGHLNAFTVLGGLPRALRYDNLRSVVTRRQPLTYNAAFLQFAHYFGFEIRLCNVRAGNEKGRVERAIRTIRETFLNTADNHHSLKALNSALLEWLCQKNDAIHRSTGQAPAALKNKEPLKALPQNPWLNRAVFPPKLPTKTGLVLFDSNQYSIPDYLVGNPLSVHAFCNRIEIYDSNGKRVAAHPRSFERNKAFLNPAHRSFTRISVKTKAERIYTVIKNLDLAFEQFLAAAEGAGDEPFRIAHAIFRLLARHARGAVLSAVRETLRQPVPRLSFLLSCLSEPSLTSQETVRPQNQNILNVTYKPRSLEEYSK